MKNYNQNLLASVVFQKLFCPSPTCTKCGMDEEWSSCNQPVTKTTISVDFKLSVSQLVAVGPSHPLHSKNFVKPKEKKNSNTIVFFCGKSIFFSKKENNLRSCLTQIKKGNSIKSWLKNIDLEGRGVKSQENPPPNFPLNGLNSSGGQ